MNLKPFFKTAQKFVTDNSPGILTGLAVAGTVTTAVLTGKAAFHVGVAASEEYREAINKDEMTSPKRLVKVYWKEFVPAAIVGAATVTCIVGATHISTRRAAAMAAAFKLSEELANEYKERVVQHLGAQKEEKMRAELAKERVERIGGVSDIIIVGSEVVFYDALTGRLFKNEMVKVEKAVNEINHQINNFYHASLTEFYEKIGLSGTIFSDEVGWNSDELLDVKYAAILVDDKAVISLEFRTTPIRGYDRCQ
jgi:hypothetical protein